MDKSWIKPTTLKTSFTGNYIRKHSLNNIYSSINMANINVILTSQYTNQSEPNSYLQRKLLSLFE